MRSWKVLNPIPIPRTYISDAIVADREGGWAQFTHTQLKFRSQKKASKVGSEPDGACVASIRT